MKYLSLTVLVTFVSLDSIGSELFPSSPYKEVFLDQADSTRCTSGV